MQLRKIIILFAAVCFIFGISCRKAENSKSAEEMHKLKVIASLFPLYDFAKNVGKDRASVALLLTPGVEPHSFEPKPADVLDLNKADIFVYTNKFMEPWVPAILKGIDSSRTLILDSSRGIKFIKEDDEMYETGHHEHAGMDPHIWLDLGNAVIMVDNIRDALIQKDPAGREYYSGNAEQYKSVLKNLDDKFRKGLSNCGKKTFINGGHFAFGYLARRYGLNYLSAYGFSPDSEPTPGQLISISKMLKERGLKYIYYEELLEPRVADALARETGAGLLLLHGAHNISKEEFQKGVTFVGLMERNLENLEVGLQCR